VTNRIVKHRSRRQETLVLDVIMLRRHESVFLKWVCEDQARNCNWELQVARLLGRQQQFPQLATLECLVEYSEQFHMVTHTGLGTLSADKSSTGLR